MYKLYLHNNEHFNNQIKGHDAVNSPLVKISEFTSIMYMAFLLKNWR